MAEPGIGIGIPQTELQSPALGVVDQSGLHTETFRFLRCAEVVFDDRIRFYLIDQSDLQAVVVFGKVDQSGRYTVIAFSPPGGKKDTPRDSLQMSIKEKLKPFFFLVKAWIPATLTPLISF